MMPLPDVELCDNANAESLAIPEGLFSKLPNEIIIHIFEFLDPLFLSRTVTVVCKRFANILRDELLWKCLLTNSIKMNILSRTIVSLQHPSNVGYAENRWTCARDLLWRDQAVQFKILELQWKLRRPKIFTRTFNHPHFAPVDTLKILPSGQHIISGGRDRLINVWNVDMDTLELKKLHSVERSHDGWVWGLDSCEPDKFYSCGWDHQVSYWSISDGLHKLSTFSLGRPVMAVSCTQGLVAAGLNVPRIVLIDPRIGVSFDGYAGVKSFDVHRHTVTDVHLVPDKNLLLSVSEDKTLCFFDLRNQKSCRTILINGENSFPRCIARYRDMIYVGDSRGNIHFQSIDFRNPDVPTINIGSDTRLITGIVPHRTGITIGSRAGFVKTLYPSSPPVILWEQAVVGEVTSVDQYKNVIAASSTNRSVLIFRASNL